MNEKAPKVSLTTEDGERIQIEKSDRSDIVAIQYNGD